MRIWMRMESLTTRMHLGISMPYREFSRGNQISLRTNPSRNNESIYQSTSAGRNSLNSYKTTESVLLWERQDQERLHNSHSTSMRRVMLRQESLVARSPEEWQQSQ